MKNPYFITKEAFYDYVKHNRQRIEELIFSSISYKSILDYGTHKICLFFYEEYISVFRIEHANTVTSTSLVEYDNFISDELLEKFIYSKEILPMEINRWACNKYKHLLKEEIKRAFIEQRITFFNIEDSKFICRWNRFNIIFILSEDLHLENIEVISTKNKGSI